MITRITSICVVYYAMYEYEYQQKMLIKLKGPGRVELEIHTLTFYFAFGSSATWKDKKFKDSAHYGVYMFFYLTAFAYIPAYLSKYPFIIRRTIIRYG